MAPSATYPDSQLNTFRKNPKSIERQPSPWADELRGSRPAELFHDKPGQTSGTTGKHEFKVEQSLCRRLHQFCATKKHDENKVLLTAFRAAQYRLNGALDANIGISGTTPRDIRLRRRSGIDVHVRCIRTAVAQDTCFSSLLQQVNRKLDMAYTSPDFSLEQITEELSSDGLGQLVKIMFSIHTQRPDNVPAALNAHLRNVPNYEIEWDMWKEGDQVCGQVLFDTELFDGRSTTTLVSTFSDILQAGMDDLNAPISSLPLSRGLWRVTQDAIHAIANPPRYGSVYDAFREQVEAHPDQIAVKDLTRSLTYSQLDVLAQRVSTWLSKREYAAETIIGVLAGRSVDAIIMYIGIVGANHAYVPLDAKSPTDRLNGMLASIGSHPLVICGADLESCTSQLDAECVPIARVLEESLNMTPVDHMLPLPTALAAVIFTSGSTGRPKGVMIEHRSIVRVAKQKSYQIPIDSTGSNPVVAHMLNPAFDAAIMEIYTALLNGSTLCCIESSTLMDSQALRDVFEQEKIRMAVFTPSVLDHYLREAPSLFTQLEVLMVGGDRFKATHALQLKRLVRGKVFNGYGPTENTVVSTLYSISSHDVHITDDLPIGQAVTGSIACVVDSRQRLVPPGIIGELVVAGDGLARGYLDPKLDIDRFVHIDIGGKAVRAYRTGDLARLRPSDMQLQFMGRIDTQVKVRGHRIEVVEIDRALLKHPDVDDAATMLYSYDGSEESVLVSFVCKTLNSSAARLDLQAQLEKSSRETLPSYMVPKAVFVVDSMPLTNNGKLDQKALAKIADMEFAATIERDRVRATAIKQPESEVEKTLKEVWALILKVPAASLASDDHFVRKGGDSLKAMRLMAEARRRGLELNISDILSSPRLSDMALVASRGTDFEASLATTTPFYDTKPFELLKHVTEDEARSAAAVQCDIFEDTIEDIFPCTPLQAGLAALNSATPSDYISRTIKELDSNVDMTRFQRAFEEVFETHPILRTRIIYLPGEGLVQLIVKETTTWRSASCLIDYIESDKEDVMSLGRPLVRAAIVDEDNRRFFVLTLMHSVFDGWTMRILFDAFDKAYRGLTIQAPPPFQSFIKAMIEHNQSEAGKQAWCSSLMGHEAEPFPRLPSPDYRPQSNAVHFRHVDTLAWNTIDVTPSVALRAALAITICQRENVQDVILGTTVTGRHSIQVPGIEQMSGPTITTVPTRATMSRLDETVGELLVRLQNEWVSLANYEHMGLSAISGLSDDAMRATGFQTLLVIQPAEVSQGNEASGLFRPDSSVGVADQDLGAISTYAMVMECQLFEDAVDIRVTFDSDIVSKAEMNRILSQYESILRQLCNPEVCQHRLAEVEWLSQDDIQEIWDWNASCPQAVNTAMHDLLTPVFQQRAHAQAICAWDGSFTYQELDRLSTRLAHHVVRKCVDLSSTIPIFVEKSRWTSVAMLAVMKAGGTSCLLDPTLPESRLRSIVEQLSPKIMLVSPGQRSSAKMIFERDIIVIDEDSMADLPIPVPGQRLPMMPPSTPLYIVFTSGSTGAPKGVVISHSNFSSAVFHQSSRRSVGQQSRVLDFSSLAFDGSWFNLLHTLYVGGCICVPSETARQNDLKGSILDLRANFAFLTPTVASTLDDEALQAFDSLEIGGEAADEEEMKRIQKHTRVRFIYGPSECTPITTLAEPGAHALSIGKPSGVRSWLVDPQVPGRLVGVGCVAELWLEGPLVGTGYHRDEARTAAAYVTNPSWMLRDRPGYAGRTGRAYRTGDLVRYHEDGSIQFVGRNNTQQVKIRGQRVELLDVQHNVQDALRRRQPDVQVIADVAEDGTLTTFVCSSSKAWLAASSDLRISLLREMAGNIKDELAGMVPKYMIPGFFIPIEAFPMGQTGKLDRRKLKSIMEGMSSEQRNLCHLDPDRADSAMSKPTTSMEKQLQSLWAAALNVNIDTITTEDNFFHRGGDSISAMKLVNLARRESLTLSVKEVWDQPRLHDLAEHLSRAQSPFSEISWSEISRSTESLEEIPPRTTNAPPSEVLPVTCSQHQFLNGILNGYGAHVYHLLIDLPSEIDPEHARKACEQWLQHFDILRTRFVYTSQRVCQVIDAEIELPWQHVRHREGDIDDTIRHTCDMDREKLNGLPDPRSCLTRLFFIEGQDGLRKLVVRLGHVQYDGSSLPRMMSTLVDLVEGRIPVIPQPFADYVRHITSRNPDSYQYWRDLLQGTDSPTIVQPTHQQATGSEQLLMASRAVTQPTVKGSAQTPAIHFVAACATMLARVTYSNDVVFGCIVSGRSSVPPELQDVCGPCLNEIPVRVSFPEQDSTPATVFEQLRGQLLESSQHETVGFDEVAAHCTSWSPDVDDFGLTVHYQNSGDSQQLKGEEGRVVPCRLVEADHPRSSPIPKSNYIEIEAIPMENGQLMINIMGKSSRYKLRFLEQLLAEVCMNMNV